MNTDDLKKRILSRWARFIAAALAATSATACGSKPQVCLEPIDPGDGSADAPSDAPSEAGDAGPDASDDAGPQPCLKVAPDAGPDDGGGNG